MAFTSDEYEIAVYGLRQGALDRYAPIAANPNLATGNGSRRTPGEHHLGNSVTILRARIIVGDDDYIR
jgi:hypothetical protein